MPKDDIQKSVKSLESEFRSFREGFNEFREEFNEFKKEVREELKEIRKVLAQHSYALLTIENTLKFYGDIFKINKENNERLDKRVTVLESTCN